MPICGARALAIEIDSHMATESLNLMHVCQKSSLIGAVCVWFYSNVSYTCVCVCVCVYMCVCVCIYMCVCVCWCSGQSPLHKAAMYDHLGICKILVENGASIFLQDTQVSLRADFTQGASDLLKPC